MVSLRKSVPFNTKLIECIEDEFLVSIAPGTQKKLKGIGVILEDTILFPEGGGQCFVDQPRGQETRKMLNYIMPYKQV